MCLPRIGRIKLISGNELERVADVDVAGTNHRVSLLCVPAASVGDAISIHAGFALSVVPDEEVEVTMAMVEVVQSPSAHDGHGSGSVVG